MAKKKSSSPNYEIGHGRPPKDTQFKKGKSGNEKGRPPGTRPIGSILQEAMRQKIAVTENGKTKKLPAIEVLIMRLRADALRGDIKSLKYLLTLYDRYAESPLAQLPMDELLAEDRAILEAFIAIESKKPPTEAEGGGSDDPV